VPHIPWKAIATGAAVLGGIGAFIRITRKSPPPAPKRAALAKIFPEFKFEGHVGNTTAAWASHAASCGTCGDWLTAFKPDVVLVALGVNDNPPNPTNYQTIVRALHGIGARVVWVEPPTGVHNDAVRQTIASLGVNTIPATRAPLVDGLHPASYSQWAREIAESVTT